ncbi:hypothetical protein PPYR_10563 [Photinus pyralis]|uniref:Small ribosomal subunit protein uS7 domain-containing protein n=1 Tax=Photinus pyralis TaxID=7054 RepID=A0A1Y1MDR2_PHOPY|nr:28S ribosomal protein S7, mitochondrial [Photinus pyralis]KAB0796502.1 hypothetical protein PPYR_10563 [Photinus pyralis]
MFTRPLLLSSKLELTRCFKFPQNGMSQYPSYYIKPIYSNDKQTDLIKSGEAQKLAHVPTRAALNDQTSSIYHDDLICLLVNYLMKDGNKLLARDLVEKTMEKIKRVQLEKYHKLANEEEKEKVVLNPRAIIHQAITNVKPILQLTPIKRGGVTYQVPVPITDRRSQFLSMKWLIEAGNEKERTVRFYDQFAYELIDAANNTGRAVKKKQDLHKQCEMNRAYAHYRWS